MKMTWHGCPISARHPRTWMIGGSIALIATLAVGGVAAAQQQARLTLTPSAAAVGGSVTVRGSGFHPQRKGMVILGRRRVGSFTASAAGRFHLRFIVPSGEHGTVLLSAEQIVITRHGVRHLLKRARAHLRILRAAGGLAPSPGGPGNSGGGGAGGPRWAPPRALTWYWQLQGSVNNSEPVAAYDIDGFDNSAAEVWTLHAQGKHVICYIDVGTAENWRPDNAAFPASVLGSSNGWPGERWLDVRQLAVLEPIMTARFQMCRAKGFDAVEPDNMDGYENSTGFPITAAQQLSYDAWVATEVHSLGMAVLQKNDGEQVRQLEPDFDGALTEQCNQYHECANFEPYLAAGKPVLNAEYSLPTSGFCAADEAAGIMGARYSMALDGSTFEACW